MKLIHLCVTVVLNLETNKFRKHGENKINYLIEEIRKQIIKVGRTGRIRGEGVGEKGGMGGGGKGRRSGRQERVGAVCHNLN